MAYSKEVLHRAEARLEQARRQNELDCERRISAIYEKLPRLAEIDRELRKTSAKVYAAAFRESESPEQAMLSSPAIISSLSFIYLMFVKRSVLLRSMLSSPPMEV